MPRGGNPAETAAATPRGSSDAHPTMIGRYRVLQKLGEGGFGIVYMAEQREPVQRRVAIKVIKHGMDTRQVIARFEAERQALALFDHPNIAGVFDAGETDAGRPYFVMELVSGVRITEYCDRNKLTIRDRLDLFLQVCSAVQHAHTKGVIHRDLKPANVLVSVQDGPPVCKVIDFGIAKATRSSLTDKTLVTEQRQLVGTPAYMSPEQAEGSSDIDTRTDVYSLGAMLYELLTGATPFSIDQLVRAGLSDVPRMIRDVEPPLPSTLISRSTADLPAVAANRRIEPDRLRPAIRGELDWIVMKCLEKDRTRRYGGAGELAADLTRFLSGEPVAAAPPSTTYRMRKFVRRHRVAVGAGTAVAAALVIGLGAALIGLRSAVRARDAEVAARAAAETARSEAARAAESAREEASKSQAALQFVAEMFGAIDPALARGHDVTVAEVIDPAAERVTHAFAGQPQAEAMVRGVLGQAYTNIARYDRANHELERAWEIRKSLGKVDDAEGLTLRFNMAVALLQGGDFARSREILEEVRHGRTALLGPEARESLAVLSLLAVARQMGGDTEGAIGDVRAVLAIQERTLGRTDRDTLDSMASLADMLESVGKLDESLKVAHDAAERARVAFGAESSVALMTQSIEAETLLTLDRYQEAAPLLEQVVRGKEKMYGEAHPGTLVSLDLLAAALRYMGRQEEAISLARKIVARSTQAQGERSPVTLTYQNNLAQALRQAGQLDEAEQIFGRLLALRKEIGGETARETLILKGNFGLLLLQRGKAKEALPLLRESLEGFQQTQPAGHWMIGYAMLNLGRCEIALHEHEEAETTLLASHAMLEKALGPSHERTIQVRRALVELYEAWPKPEAAKEWRDPPTSTTSRDAG